MRQLSVVELVEVDLTVLERTGAQTARRPRRCLGIALLPKAA